MTNKRKHDRMVRDYLNELDARERFTRGDADAHAARTDNPHDVLHSQLTDVSEEDINPHGTSRWQSPYVVGNDYKKDDLVKDGDWTMIANKDTNDRAAPQPLGPEFNIYDGASPTTQNTAKQVVFGNRYTFDQAAYINGYRLYAVAGKTYRIFLVRDPLGTPIIEELALFVATTAGWIAFAIGNLLIGIGAKFDLVAVVYEPDPTPTVFSGDWNYTTPQNPGIPALGDIIHSTKTLGVMSISSTDDAAGDRYAELATLTIGDIIEGAGQRWSIQSITDNTTYFNFGVSPAAQGSPIGIQNFNFETVVATPITYMEDPAYWPTSPFPAVQGLIAIDDNYGDITVNTNAYGLDIYVQQVEISDDWDLVAVSSGSGGSSSGVLSNVGIDTVGVTYSVVTSDIAWTEIYRSEIPAYGGYVATCHFDAYRLDAADYYNSKLRVLAFTGSVDSEQVYELGPNLMGCRALLDGNELVLEVRGMPGQDWAWRYVPYWRVI